MSAEYRLTRRRLLTGGAAFATATAAMGLAAQKWPALADSADETFATAAALERLLGRLYRSALVRGWATGLNEEDRQLVENARDQTDLHSEALRRSGSSPTEAISLPPIPELDTRAGFLGVAIEGEGAAVGFYLAALSQARPSAANMVLVSIGANHAERAALLRKSNGQDAMPPTAFERRPDLAPAAAFLSARGQGAR